MKAKFIPLEQVNLPEAYWDGFSVTVPKLEDESETLYIMRKNDWIKYFYTRKVEQLVQSKKE